MELERCQVKNCCELCQDIRCKACLQPLGRAKGPEGLIDGLCVECADEMVENAHRPPTDKQKKGADRLLTVAQAAQLLKYSPATVRRKIKNKSIVAFEVNGSESLNGVRYRIPYSEAVKLLRQRRAS